MLQKKKGGRDFRGAAIKRHRRYVERAVDMRVIF